MRVRCVERVQNTPREADLARRVLYYRPLGVGGSTPLVDCDARQRESVEHVLLALTEEVLAKQLSKEGAGSGW